VVVAANVEVVVLLSVVNLVSVIVILEVEITVLDFIVDNVVKIVTKVVDS